MKVNLLHKIGIIGFGNMGSIIAHKLAAQTNEYEITVFENGRAIIKGTEDAGQAKSLYAKYIELDDEGAQEIWDDY